MSVITFDVAAFRKAYPEFATSCATVTNDQLQSFFDTASVYISNIFNGCLGLKLVEQTLMLNLMTAHLAMISSMIMKGNTPGIVESATVDKVTITLALPEYENQWQNWLASTPYGAQLYALLQMKSAGGFYFGGNAEISAFRKAGGVF